MSNEKLMDPQDFAERLERGFGSEPPHAPAEEDLGRGRRRLRRRRAGTSLAALADRRRDRRWRIPASRDCWARTPRPRSRPAAGGEISAAEIVATCLRKENVSHYANGRVSQRVGRAALMGDGRG